MGMLLRRRYKDNPKPAEKPETKAEQPKAEKPKRAAKPKEKGEA